MKNMRSGMVNANDFAVNYLCQSLPFGGIGESGFGRFAGEEGLRGCCYERASTEDKFEILGIRASIPSVVQYPQKVAGPIFVTNLITLIYGKGFKSKLISFWDIIQSAMSSE